jgi:hypothetical protein
MKLFFSLITVITFSIFFSLFSNPSHADEPIIITPAICPPGHEATPVEGAELGVVRCSHPSGGNPDLGTITPPSGTVPTASGDPSAFIAGIIRNGLWLLIIVGFLIGLLWTIFAGFSFIFAGGDPQKVAQSWSRIYWGLIGLVIVVGSFAIIKLVETFFNVSIISGGFSIPSL